MEEAGPMRIGTGVCKNQHNETESVQPVLQLETKGWDAV